MQRFDLVLDDHAHRVEVESGGLRQHLRWYVDDALVAERRTSEEKVRLESEEHGSVAVRLSVLGKPRSAVLHPTGSDLGALAGVGGTDLVPEPGSPAAAYEQRLRDHPRRHVALETLGGVAKVVVPLVLFALLARFAFSLPLPSIDLPSVPLPDLPDVPWPDLPSIPWPDVTLPGWVSEVADVLKLVFPVALAFVLARAEVRRRRRQDEERRDRD